MKKQKRASSQKQLSFFKPHKKFFGGALLSGKRKSIRPLSSKDSIHFVLRSQWAMGRDSFLAARNRQSIERIIRSFALKFGVRIYRQAINSNHIHLLLKITNRVLYRAFIKAVNGKIASHVMGEQSFKLFSQARQGLKALNKEYGAGDGSAERIRGLGICGL
ncbi:MAG: transposase [Bdellovibrio sp.]|nr:transposase [Bdellovibrio sp.]